MEVFLLDDGSSDGTAHAINEMFPSGVHVELSGGDCYWARGMARAQQMAELHDPDFMLWINDDIEIDSRAIETLLEVSCSTKPAAIAVGAMVDPKDGHVVYSGTRLGGRRPGSLRLVIPSGSAVPIDSFHGNLVLVPRSAYVIVGTVDPAFAHAYGDNDYGLRARGSGIPMRLAPVPLGKCTGNPLDQVWLSSRGTRRDRTRQLFGRKGLPLRSHVLYNTRHAGAAGIIYAAGSYVKALHTIWMR